jgi:hypothetical protein
MDGQPCRHFFLDPLLTFHRRYEALRAFFVDDGPVAEIASHFGYKPTGPARRIVSRFRKGIVSRGQHLLGGLPSHPLPG